MQVAVNFRIRQRKFSTMCVSLSCRAIIFVVTFAFVAIIRTRIYRRRGLINQSQLSSASLRVHFRRRHVIQQSRGHIHEFKKTQNNESTSVFVFVLFISASVSPLAGIIILGTGSLRPFSLQLLPSSKSNPILSIPSHTL